MDTKSLERKIEELNTSIDILILLEFCKRKIKRDDVREVFGSLDNNLFARVNKVINLKEQK